jgi:hypothetical protein
LITKLTLCAAARRDASASTTRTTRSRKSTEYGRHPSLDLLIPAASLNQNNRTFAKCSIDSVYALAFINDELRYSTHELLSGRGKRL